VLEDAARQQNVGVLAGVVHEIASRHPQDEVEAVDDEDAGRQHPKRLDRVVGHDAVIDVHEKQRCRQRKQIDHQRGDDGMRIDRPEPRERAPEPGFLRGFRNILRAIVEAVFGLRE
jgi:hypothetical protein